MPDEWLRALEPLGTDEHKPFLEIAPWLVVLFRQNHGVGPDGELVRHYYVAESVGIAAGHVPDRGAPGRTGGADAHPQSRWASCGRSWSAPPTRRRAC